MRTGAQPWVLVPTDTFPFMSIVLSKPAKEKGAASRRSSASEKRTPSSTKEKRNASDNPSIRITFTYDPAINYAFQQNMIPVLRELVVRNSDFPRKELKVSLRTEPAFADAVELHIQS